MIARLADRYDVVRELGRGAMGQVLLARQVNLGRLVVLKRVLPEATVRQGEALIDEARVAARLHHPCIVDILDAHPDGESVVIAMEYVPGVTLREMLARAPDGLPADVALTIALDLLRGLAYAHGVRHGAHAGIVHRDVKPRNVIVTFAGDTKLIDFGISRWLSDDGVWDATSISGTFGYMPPEQEQGGRVDGRADEYAVGVTLRELLTGRPPKGRGPEASTAPGRPAPAPAPTLDAELEAILARACAAAPDDRYPGCAQLAEALADYAKANALVLSPARVERWLAAHAADRIAAWEREVERESNPRLPGEPVGGTERGTEHTSNPLGTEEASSPPPGTEEASSPPPGTEEASSPPPGTEEASSRGRGSRSSVKAGSARSIGARSAAGAKTQPQVGHRSRHLWWFAVLAVALALAVVWFARTSPPSTPAPRVVRITPMTIGDPDDVWLARGAGNILARTLRDATPRRLWVASVGDPRAIEVIELTVTHTDEAIRISAHRAGAGASLVEVEAHSVSEGVARLAGPLADALGAGHDDLGPDAAETAEMTRVGARSFDQYRRYRALAEEVRMSGWIDPAAFEARFDALRAEDPTWPRPYVELYWLASTIPDGPRAAQVLAEARAHADPRRDRAAMAALEAAAENSQAHFAEAEAALAPVFKANDRDMLVGEARVNALQGLERTDDVRAVLRHLADVYPHLYFASRVATELEHDSRKDDERKMLRSFVEAAPDDLTAASVLVDVESRHGDRELARRDARRMFWIWGEEPIAMFELFDAMVTGDDLAEAQRLADKMLLGSPLARARGRYRSAVIAVLEGRFEAGVRLAKQAITELDAGGHHFETVLPQALLRDIGDHATRSAALDALIASFTEERFAPAIAAYGYFKALEDRGTTCPPLEPFLAGLEGEERTGARLEMVRAGSLVGCAPCKEVLALGPTGTETPARSLVAFGRCARDAGHLDLARQAFEDAIHEWSGASEDSPYYSLLAHHDLATVLAALGDAAGARAEDEQLVRAWGHADRMIPEVDAARRAIEVGEAVGPKQGR